MQINNPISIPAGITRDLFGEGDGHHSIHGKPGDLLIALKIKPHPYFVRSEFNIITD